VIARHLLAAAALAATLAACSPAAPAAEQAAPTGATTAAAGAPAAVRLCEHGVPAELCTKCNPDLVPVFKEQGDWCREHGVPESQCLRCNPKLTFTAQLAPRDWCKEHAVPESKCTKCNPRLVASFVEAGDYCREHGYPASVCPLCHPELLEAAGEKPPVFPEPGTKVRLASVQTALDAGIQTRAAALGRIARAGEVVGQLTFDQNRLALLSARGDGLVVEVKVDVGDDVREGQVLAVLSSSAVGADQARLAASQARFEAARSAVEREQQLGEGGLSPRKNLEEARRELAAAQAEIDAARSALGAAGASLDSGGGRYLLRAPFAGTVVARDAVAGRSAMAGQVLVQVADLSTMWAQLEVPEADAALVRPGQPVRISFEGMRGPSREAKVTRVSASVDPASRTVRARVELPNRERTLKAGAFLRAQIHVTADHEALLVPREAVQLAESRTLVFVKRGASLYEPVAVQTGETAGDLVELVSGLEPGAEVVTTGAFLLKTEIMKASIGAGCCDLEEKK
jgi:cobalt-zinc-cadmium efflux system membrane fusion protein